MVSTRSPAGLWGRAAGSLPFVNRCNSIYLRGSILRLILNARTLALKLLSRQSNLTNQGSSSRTLQWPSARGGQFIHQRGVNQALTFITAIILRVSS